MSAANETWVWLGAALILVAHEEQLAEHGGPGGVCDQSMLESALARPQHRALYGTPDVADLAASYAFGLARNHPFVDGNKRAAFVALEVFLELNGWSLTASDESCVTTILRLAAGQLEEDELAAWIRAHSEKH